jgi:hypothetical protein
MSEIVGWIVAEAEQAGRVGNVELQRKRTAKEKLAVTELPVHAFPGKKDTRGFAEEDRRESESYYERDRLQRIYRSRTITMLRRYMRYSIETGRLPSMVGREFFRSKVTSYRVTTFEDRVIFVHDMETCLQRLNGFSREVLARIVLQEYGQEDAARLLGCTRMTVHRRLLEALDGLSGILLEVGLLARVCTDDEESCQAGKDANTLVSDCESDK